LRRTAVEVHISWDGERIWVNTAEGCVLRISGIEHLIVHDDRRK
jgi:hypothetical protein